MKPSWKTVLESVSNDALHLILLPTEACNFRCVYCYEDFRYKRMEPWVQAGVMRLLSRRAGDLERLTISWFGGEPLLARDIIENVMTHAQALGRAHTRLSVTSDMTTNGFLLSREVLDRLVGLGVTRFQVSFDGPQAWHDRKRVLAGGLGTFDRVWGNLLEARGSSLEFLVTVRVHVDRENADAMHAFIDGYEQSFGADSRFELFLRPLSQLGGPNDATLQVYDHKQGEHVVGALRREAAGRGLRLMQSGPEDSVCYAARGNSFVVRANGRLNKCTVALEHPNNQVGEIREDGTLRIDSPRVSMWMRGLRSWKPGELECPMHGYADGPERVDGPERIMPVGKP